MKRGDSIITTHNNDLQRAQEPRRRRLVLIDTCEPFCEKMKLAADQKNFDLTCFSSISDMGSVGSFTGFDVAIIEDLCGDISGIEIGQYLESFIPGMPMIIISSGSDPTKLERASWPFSIRSFVHKDQGVEVILDAANNTF